MFIYLGRLSKTMLIPLLIPILYSIRHYLLDELDLKFNNYQSVFLHTFITSISYSLNLFLLLIENSSTRSYKTKTIDKEFNNQLLIEKRRIDKRQSQLKVLYLVLLPLFLFFNLLSYDIFSIFKPKDYKKNYFYTLSIPIFFILTALMSYQFLNLNLYRHQIASMIISFLLSLSLFLIFFLLDNGNNSVYSILFLFQNIGLRSLRYVLVVLAKLFMIKMYVTPIKLMTFLGIFGIIFSLITNGLSFLVDMNFIKNPELDGFFYIDEKTGFKRLLTIFDNFRELGDCILYFIGTIIFFFFEKYMSWFCIYTFSPNHYIMYASINTLFAIFMEICIQFKTNYSKIQNILIFIFSLVFLIFIFLCGLIFNEILIIRLLKLDTYTNVEIDKRQKDEIKISLTNDINNNNNNNNPNNSFESD